MKDPEESSENDFNNTSAVEIISSAELGKKGKDVVILRTEDEEKNNKKKNNKK